MGNTIKGAKRKVEVSLCAWIDLLGYGSMLFESQFDPTVELAQNAIERLNIFHKTAASHACRRLHMYALNDGLICHVDVSPRSKSVTTDFIKRVIRLHQHINTVDAEMEYYGARMIISAGFRVRSSENLIVESGIKNAIFRNLKNGFINPAQAINMALKDKPYFGIIPELQANFAFSKSYLVDSKGSKGGFAGPNCFIDLSIFSNPLPKFITFSEYQNFNDFGMWAKYGKLESFNFDLCQDSGFLNAFEIAENITKSPNAEKRIRELTKQNRKT